MDRSTRTVRSLDQSLPASVGRRILEDVFESLHRAALLFDPRGAHLWSSSSAEAVVQSIIATQRAHFAESEIVPRDAVLLRIFESRGQAKSVLAWGEKGSATVLQCHWAQIEQGGPPLHFCELMLNGLPGTLNVDALKKHFDLTPKELAVAQLMYEGRSVAALAAELDICLATVRVHIKRIHAKTECSTRAALIVALQKFVLN